MALAAALLVSICFNLFAAGAMLGGHLTERRVAVAAGRVLEAYPPAIRRDVMRRLIAERAELMEAVAELRQARQAMFAQMRADPLDRAVLARTMAEVRDRISTVQALLQNALLASIEAAPAAERQSIRPPAQFGDRFELREE